MAGQSLQEELTRNNYLVGTNGSTDKLTTANASSILRSISSTETSSALLSYYARLNYAYKAKYLLAASFRSDGSSKFGKDNRFANFPSVSAGWVVNEESFLKDVTLITQLKLRAAWGKTGNQTALGNFQALGLVVPGYDYVNPGIGPTASGIPNQSLLWEASDQADIGVDFTILGGRIGIIADWYSKNTESLLLNEPLPYTSGFTSVVKNIGKIRNSGLDIELNARILTGNLKWNMGGNISFLNNKVLALGSNNAAMINGKSIVEVGKPLGNFYGWEFLGVYATNADVPAGAGPNGKLTITGGKEFIEGTPIFKDQNKDGIIDNSDRVVIGNALADYTGALNNSFTYKGFEFNTMFTFSKGNDIANTIRANGDMHTGPYRNCTPEAWNERWKKTGDVTNWPRIVVESTMYGNYYNNSSQFIEDGSFIRLRNITFAYNFSDKITRKLQISKLRLYVTGENIRTWTKYSGYDPELVDIDNPLTIGYSAIKVPMALSVIFGVNIGL
jgi:TonB-linked SusC/RagA family outer membrane protein